MRYRDVEQAFFRPSATMVPSCSLRSRTLHAACGGGQRPSLTSVARAGAWWGRSGQQDGRFDRTTGWPAGLSGEVIWFESSAVLGDAVDRMQQLAHGGDE